MFNTHQLYLFSSPFVYHQSCAKDHRSLPSTPRRRISSSPVPPPPPPPVPLSPIPEVSLQAGAPLVSSFRRRLPPCRTLAVSTAPTTLASTRTSRAATSTGAVIMVSLKEKKKFGSLNREFAGSFDCHLGSRLCFLGSK